MLYVLLNSIDLKKPILKDGKFTEDPDLKKSLMPRNEFSTWYKQNGNKYMWDNYYEDLSLTKTGKGERIYIKKCDNNKYSQSIVPNLNIAHIILFKDVSTLERLLIVRRGPRKSNG